MTRIEWSFLALVGAQAAHSIEEYLGRLWEVFPPAKFLTGLVSDDLERGFVIINVSLFLFGVACWLGPVRHRWPVRSALIGFWLAIELVNGVGHPLWTLAQGGYTPGVATAPLLLVAALVVLRDFTRERADRVAAHVG